MKKKLIAGMTSAAVIASLSAPAFAANFGDVKGTPSESSTALLKALGIVNGDVNGNFNPNATITRAEFAKIAVNLAGLGAAAAAYGTGAATGFNDVPAGHWAAGYVAVAKSAGLVKGYDQWNFGPTDNVRYEDILTVFERILGFNDQLPGGYSAGYVVKGSALGLIKNTQFQVGKSATRGDVAIVAQAALNATEVSYDNTNNAFYTRYVPGTATPLTLISDKFSSSVQSGQLVDFAGTADGLGDKQVKIKGTSSTGTYNVTADTIFAGGSASELFGHDVKFMADADNNLNYVGDASAVSNVLTGALDDLTVDVATNVYQAKVGGNTYTLASDAVVFFNGKANTASYVYGQKANVSTVNAVLNKKGEVSFLSAKAYATPFVAAADGVAKTATTNAFVDGVKFADNAVVTRNGKSASVADIKKGDVVYVATPQGATNAQFVDVYSSQVTGALSSYSVDPSGKLLAVVVGGTTYSVNSTLSGNAGYNLTGLAVNPWVSTTGSVTLTLDKDGKVAKAEQTATTVNKSTSFIEKVETVSLLKDNVVTPYTQVTLLGADGVKQVKYIAQDSTQTKLQSGAYPNVTTLAAGNLASVAYDSNGYISKNTVVETIGGVVTLGSTDVNTTNNTLTIGNATYNVSASTTFYDVHDTDLTKAAVSNLAALKSGYKVRAIVDAANKANLKAVLIDSNTGVSAQAAQVSGLFVKKFDQFDGTNTTSYVTLNVNGTNQDIKLSTIAGYNAFGGATVNKNDLVVVKDVYETDANSVVVGNGSYDTVAQAQVATAVNADSTITNGFKATIGATPTNFVYDANTKVYVNKTTSGTVSVGSLSDFTQYLQSGVTFPQGIELVATSKNVGGYTVVDAIVVKLAQ